MNDGTENMLRCTEIRLELLDLLQDRLSPEGRASVEGHVSACASCANELQSLPLVLVKFACPHYACTK